MHADVERFYEQLARLRAIPGQGMPLSDYTGRSPWPERGVYFFFEPGELRSSSPAVPRVVRVGTHAVTVTSRSKLWGRLRAHRGNRNGGGNHRGSVFRRHVGDAILARGGQLSGTWGVGQNAARAVRLTEGDVEAAVSLHVGSMSVLWVAIPDDPGPASHRAMIEQNAIALLSGRNAPSDPPSVGWLGRHSTRADIVKSGLWNVDYVSRAYDPRLLDWFKSAADAMLA